MSGAAEFSVYWQDPDGNDHEERRFITSDKAVDLAMNLTLRPAARIGIIRRVIITDGGDCTVLEWLYGKGITWPEGMQKQIEQQRLNYLRSRYEGNGPELTEAEMNELRTLENRPKFDA